MLTADRLRALAAISREGSIAGAAERLGLTPSAVSQQIAALERDLETVLLERGRRGSRLTTAGLALYAHAEAVLDRLADAEAELHAIAAGEAGSLAIGSFPTATAALTAQVTADFRGLHPGVALRLVDGEPADSAARLVARVLDMAVVFDLDSWPASRSYEGAEVCDDGALERVHLFDDPFLLAVPTGHPLAAEQRASVDQLRGERLVGSANASAPWGPDLAATCRAAGFDPVFDELWSTDFSALLGCVAAGLGLTLLPRLALDHDRDDIVIVELDGAPVRHVNVAFPAGALRTRAAEDMLALLRARAQGRSTQSPAGRPYMRASVPAS